MKRTRFSRLAVVSLICLAAMGSGLPAAEGGSLAEQTAQETESMKQAVDGRVQQMLDAPAGIFDIEYENGGIARLKIKGEAEVSTALRGTRAERQARDKAERDAKAAFSQFLNEEIVVVEGDAEAFIVQEKNGSESAEYHSASGSLTLLFSKASLRGLVVLLDHIEGEGDSRKAVVVLGWSKKLTEAAMQAESDMAGSQAPAAKDALAAPRAESSSGSKTENTTVTRIGNLDGF